MSDISTPYSSIVLVSIFGGALGGIASFLYGMATRQYKNGKYLAKFSIEIIGAAVMASIVAPLTSNDILISGPISFAVGFSWSSIIQAARNKLTHLLEDVIKENIRRRS